MDFTILDLTNLVVLLGKRRSEINFIARENSSPSLRLQRVYGIFLIVLIITFTSFKF